MTDKMFVVSWIRQEAEINLHCFGDCGQTIFGMVYDSEFGALAHCYQEKCPFQAELVEEPFGEVNGHLVYARVLKSEDEKHDIILPVTSR